MPPAPAAPPPVAKPAPSPNAKPSAPPSPPKPSENEGARFQTEYDELDALAQDKPAPKPKVEPKTEPEPVDELEDIQGEVKPPEGVKAPDLKPGEKKGTKHEESVKELKRRYVELQEKETKEYIPKLARITELETKLAEYEKNIGETQKQYEERVAAAEKRATELEQEIEFVNFSKSQKFQNEYAKPYQEAWTKAVGDFSQLMVKVQTGTDEMGEPTYQTRKAGAEDLLALANMPLSEMDDAAERMFGKSAPRVIRHVEKVRELSEKQSEALANAHKNGSERQKQREKEKSDFEAQRNSKWTEVNKGLLAKYPKLFGPVEDDPEHNEMLKKSYERVDRLFAPKEETKYKSVEEAIQAHATIRAEAASFRPTARKLKLANARIAELESELKQYQDSEPPAGSAGAKARTATTNWREEAEAEIDALNMK